MRLLEGSSSPSSSSNTDIIEFIRTSPVVRLALVIGSISFAGYMSIRFWRELQGLL